MTKHGEGRKGRETTEYRTWTRMKSRCENPNDASYRHYGGRGIVVCARWSSSYPAFLTDMGRRPSSGHSVDRINNDGNYEPGNCRWATRSEQNSNYSRNRRLTWQGATLTLSQWSARTGIGATVISARLDELGWTVEEALSMPVGLAASQPRGQDRKTHCTNGHAYTPENSGRDSAGWRFCRTCSRGRSRNYMRRKRRRKNT